MTSSGMAALGRTATDLTDAQWDLIDPVLPSPPGRRVREASGTTVLR